MMLSKALKYKPAGVMR
jgi:phytoene dehydrogenase-like protein